MTSSTSTYEWIIPSSIEHIDEIIIHGYYRQICHHQIINDIAHKIQEFIEFDYSGIPFNQYTLYDIKHARCDSFLSPMFSAESLKFYMILFADDHEDTLKLELHLPAIARHQIKFNFTINIKELNHSSNHHVIFESGFDNMTQIELKSSLHSLLDISSAPSNPLQKLTVEFNKEHPTKLHAISKSRPLPTLRYLWSITDKGTLNAIANKEGFNNNKFVCSPQFAFGPFRWYLSIIPMKHNWNDKIYTFSVYLHLLSMPRGIDEMLIRCKSYFRERNRSNYAHDIVFGHYNLRNKILEVNENKLQSIKLFVELCVYEAYNVQYRNRNSNRNVNRGRGGARSLKTNSPNFTSSRFIQKRQITNNYIEHFISSKPRLVHVVPPTYRWNVKNIRSHKAMWGITSPLFRAHCLKWYLTMYPNGETQQNNGQIDIELTLASRPSLDLPICACCTLEIEELGLKWKEMVNLDNGILDNQVAMSIDAPSGHKQLASLSEMTVKVSFDLVLIADVVCEMDESVDEVVVAPGTYEWNVDNTLLLESTWQHRQHRLGFQSDLFQIFGMEWYLSVYPRCARNREAPSVQLTLIQLPDNVQVIWTRCVFTIDTLGIQNIVHGVFTEDNLDIGWGEDLFCTEDLKDNCTLRVDVEVVDVYDTGGVNVTNQFVRNGDAVNGNNLCTQKVHNKVDDTLERWLCQEMDLSQYLELFVQHGICSLSVAKMLSAHELREMGIACIGDRVRILHALQQLQM